MRTLVLAFAAIATQAAAQPIFIHLGSETQADDVSSDGQLVVGSRTIGGTGTIFRWTEGGGFNDLGPGLMPSVSSDSSTMAWLTSTNQVRRWTSGSGATTIGSIVSGSPAVEISGDGSTVAFGSQRWSTATGTTALGVPAGLAAGTSHSWAINYDGSAIVGAYSIQGGTSHPTRWNPLGQGTSLGAIPNNPIDGTATAISDDGSVIYGLADGVGLDTFRWTQQTGMVGLGAASSGLNFPIPEDVTADGNITVGSALGRAFVWRDGSGPQDIKFVLETVYGLDLEYYSLDSARGISDDGRTIVGFGIDFNTNGRFGWVVHLPWSIPSPGALALFGCFGLGLTRRSRSLA